VKIGAADPGAIHPDQHVIQTAGRFGDILEPKARF